MSVASQEDIAFKFILEGFAESLQQSLKTEDPRPFLIRK